jgi:cytochrome c oxidase subunit 1
MDFTGALVGFEYSGIAYTMMAVGSIGGLLAIVGGAAFLLVTVGSLLFGKKLEASAGILESFIGKPLSASVYSTSRPETLPMAPRLTVEGHGSAGFEAPGTFALAMVLLISFVVYYFINWKYLASVWPMG